MLFIAFACTSSFDADAPSLIISYKDPELNWCVNNFSNKNIILFIYPNSGMESQKRNFVYFESKTIVITTMTGTWKGFKNDYDNYRLPYGVLSLHSMNTFCGKFNLKKDPFNSILNIQRDNIIFSRNYWINSNTPNLPLQDSEVIMEIGWLTEDEFLLDKSYEYYYEKHIMYYRDEMIGIDNLHKFNPAILRSNNLKIQ